MGVNIAGSFQLKLPVPSPWLLHTSCERVRLISTGRPPFFPHPSPTAHWNLGEPSRVAQPPVILTRLGPRSLGLAVGGGPRSGSGCDMRPARTGSLWGGRKFHPSRLR
ncbi:hypothetical protein chiPu_0003659 [Chiloscyllium punctatum]|uniref:Uncharacterized protein n=1 Tax=Chiloscyllium punctatum TaxID=137246 RepID=A0A401S4E2_CHIPU|nr:hypothetical protein [Chiloscyllium punctatum]